MGLKVRLGDFGALLCDEKGVPLVRDDQGRLVRQTSERVGNTIDGNKKNT